MSSDENDYWPLHEAATIIGVSIEELERSHPDNIFEINRYDYLDCEIGSFGGKVTSDSIRRDFIVNHCSTEELPF